MVEKEMDTEDEEVAELGRLDASDGELFREIEDIIAGLSPGLPSPRN